MLLLHKILRYERLNKFVVMFCIVNMSMLARRFYF